jgi:hypothetical protein
MTTALTTLDGPKNFLGEANPLDTPHGCRDWFDDHVSQARDKPPGTISVPVIVTPELARLLMTHNVSNRTVKKANLQKIKLDLEGGAWKPNGQTVVISVGGELNDGQHRLRAIIETGVSAYILVTFGWPRQSRLTLDIGTKRSIGDALTIDGHHHASELGAVARKLWSLEKHGRIFETNENNASNQVSSATLQGYIDSTKLADELSEALRSVPQAVKIRAVAKRSDFYLLAILLRRKNPDQATVFLKSLITGELLSNDNPIYRFREYAIKNRRTITSQSFHDKGLEAWKRWPKYRKGAPT